MSEINQINNVNQLEAKKLRLEIRDLQKEWWKRPAYIGVFIPALLTLFSLIYALSSGFFDKKYEALQIKKDTLELEILKFESEKQIFIAQRDSAIMEADNAKIENDLLRQQLNSISTTPPIINYDKEGRIIEVITTAGKSHNYTYDPDGRLTKTTDPLGNTTTLNYDAIDRMVSITYPNGKMITYDYDSLGNRIMMKVYE